MADFFRDLAVHAPAAFLVGLIVGFILRGRYTITKTPKDGEP